MRKTLIILVTLATLTLSATATAGNPSLCAKDGWQSAQASNGSTFESLPECAKARSVFRPVLIVNVGAVVAGETFTLDGLGFHPSTDAMLSIAVTGQAPYFSVPTTTDVFGQAGFLLSFTGCGGSPDFLTLTLTDSFGVNASTTLRLC